MKKCYGEIHHGHMISASDVIDVRWHIRGVVGAFRRPRRRTERTFIMRMMVFIAIMIMMKYSNGDETTRRQTRNLNELRFFGI